MQHNFILLTAGHVDHGKSALVKALTGTDPDRLPEEKARGITIDLGFAHLELVSPNVPQDRFSIGIIDVPGHEHFVKNMVAGTGAIDLALLVVSAEDGWMPQSEEHLQILTYLDVKQVVVALTKVDLVDSTMAVETAIRARLNGTPFHNAPIVKTSIHQPNSLTDLRTQLALHFAALQSPSDIGKPRLFVDRVFTLSGPGTVVTGTVTGGCFHRTQMVMAQPSGLAARIRAIHNHHQEVSEIGPGTRAALNLPELPVAQRARDQGIRRGDVVTLAELGEARDVFDVLLTRISRPLEQMPLLRHGTCVRVHHGSANFVGRIFLEKGKTVEPGQTILAQIRLASPAFMFLGDRFVIRDDAEQHTHAGGIILDAETKQGRFRTPDRLECLRARAPLPLAVDSILANEIKRNRTALHRTCLKKSGFSQHEIDEGWQRLAEDGKVLLLGDLAVDPAWWATVVDHAAAMIEAKHREHPDHLGLEVSRLRLRLPDEPALFHALVIDLRERHFIRVGEIIKRDSHRPALPANLQATGESLRNTFNSKPFDPPSIKEVATNVSAQQALQFLIRTGELIEISTEAVLTFQAFERMRTAVVSHLDRDGSATVSELRQLLGSSRRIMVPFLERLDRDGLTKREGDRRTLRR